MVKERRPDGSVRTYVDKDMNQSIILNLLENFMQKQISVEKLDIIFPDL